MHGLVRRARSTEWGRATELEARDRGRATELEARERGRATEFELRVSVVYCWKCKCIVI